MNDKILQKHLSLYEGYEGKGDYDAEIAFLKAYWLDESELIEKWMPIQNVIFDKNAEDFPDMMFNPGFELIVEIGGSLFNQKDFEALQYCMKQVGDKEFVVIENYDKDNPYDLRPQLRFKFPIDITWGQLMNGTNLSADLFQLMERSFFVYGNSGMWGKYVANDYHDVSVDSAGTPLKIIAFKKEYENIFRKYFRMPEKDLEGLIDFELTLYGKKVKKRAIDVHNKETLKKWTPPLYQKYLKF